MQLFYNANITEGDEFINFSKDESRHIIKVLRKSIADKLNITNGKGWLFTAEIININSKSCEAKIVEAKLQPPRPYRLHLAVAPTKMNDRYEWFLEKATEIGIDSITPIICHNSERKTIKEDRYERVIQSAVKQSLNCYFPKLNSARSFSDFINQDLEEQRFIAHCENTNRIHLKDCVKPNQHILILIGPEGDFSISEIEEAALKNFKPITLGNSRLRTETAAIVAVHTVALINQ